MITTPIASTSSLTEEEKYKQWCLNTPDIFGKKDYEYPLPPRGYPTVWDEASKTWSDKKTPIPKTPYVWLTINPAPEYWTKEAFLPIAKRMERMVKNKPFEASIYVFEQESIDDTYQHPHIHCLIKRRGIPSALETMIRKNMGQYCGNDQHIRIVNNISFQQCKVKMAYMSGHKKGNNKKGVSKADIVANDGKWRAYMGFKALYGEIAL